MPVQGKAGLRLRGGLTALRREAHQDQRPLVELGSPDKERVSAGAGSQRVL